MAIQILQFFLIKSNITPIERETTVKAEIEKIKGGTNCAINHLSIRGTILIKNDIFYKIIKHKFI